MLELAFVLRAVKAAFRIFDESGVIKLPKFVAADSNAFSRAAGAGVGSDQRPMKPRSVRVLRDIIHRYFSYPENRA